MERFAKLLALRQDSDRTCHCYYRDMRLVHEWAEQDPAKITEEQLRNYFLFAKKTVLQAPHGADHQVAPVSPLALSASGNNNRAPPEPKTTTAVA